MKIVLWNGKRHDPKAMPYPKTICCFMNPVLADGVKFLQFKKAAVYRLPRRNRWPG